MKTKFSQTIATILFLFTYSAHAEAFEMADSMRSDGKIYIVVGVILTIFTGMIFYLVKIDLNITKLEKVIKEKKGQK